MAPHRYKYVEDERREVLAWQILGNNSKLKWEEKRLTKAEQKDLNDKLDTESTGEGTARGETMLSSTEEK